MSDCELLLSYVAPEKRAAFAAYVDDLVENDDRFGIDHHELGFMSDYVNFAALLKRKADVADITGGVFGGRRQRERVVVYDVGCCTALQHVLFDPRIDYVGIDVGQGDGDTWAPRFFRDGCTFIRGRFVDVIKTLAIPRGAVGIANMSLLYGSADELPAFDAAFRQKFVL